MGIMYPRPLMSKLTSRRQTSKKATNGARCFSLHRQYIRVDAQFRLSISDVPEKDSVENHNWYRTYLLEPRLISYHKGETTKQSWLLAGGHNHKRRLLTLPLAGNSVVQPNLGLGIG